MLVYALKSLFTMCAFRVLNAHRYCCLNNSYTMGNTEAFGGSETLHLRNVGFFKTASPSQISPVFILFVCLMYFYLIRTFSF